MYNPQLMKFFLATGVFVIAVMFLYSVDINYSVICRLESGKYTPEEISDIPPDLEYLTKSIDAAKDKRRQVLKFLQQPVINEFNISYKVPQDWRCKDPKLKVAIMVPSGRPNFARRVRFREGPIANFTKHHPNVTFVFFVGSGRDVQQKLDREIQSHKDIVVTDFEDGYTRILQKHVAMMNWVISFCPQVDFVLRFDDDIGLVSKMGNVIRALRRHRAERSHFILGQQRVGDWPRRDVRYKTALTLEQYAPDFFPPYVIGGALGYPLSTGKLLFQAIQRIRTIWLDDVFVTGICAAALDIPTFNDVTFRFYH